MCSKEGENILLLDIRSTRDVNDEVTKLLPVTDGKKNVRLCDTIDQGH